MTRIVPGSAGTAGSRAWSGRRMRGHRGSGDIALPREWACPDCGLTTRDEVAIRLGYCSRCRDFTGMCGAGRTIVSSGIISRTTWHTPCVNLSTAAWQVLDGPAARITRLCLAHDEQLRSGAAPWVRYAIPLEDVPGTG